MRLNACVARAALRRAPGQHDDFGAARGATAGIAAVRASPLVRATAAITATRVATIRATALVRPTAAIAAAGVAAVRASATTATARIAAV